MPRPLRPLTALLARRLASVLLAFAPACACVASTLAPGAAHAAGDDVDEEIARRHYAEGSGFYQKGDYKRALVAFEAARKVKPLPAFDFNIGRCLDRLERGRDAVTAYERYLAVKPDAEDAAEIRARVEVLRARGQESPPFVAGPTLVTGDKPRAVIIDDLNHDGRADVAVADEAGQSITVFLGAEAGLPPRGVAYPLRFSPVGLAAADLDGDGATDLVAIDEIHTHIGVLRGAGDGTFQPQSLWYDGGMTSLGLSAIALGDLDRDGHPDLVGVGKAGFFEAYLGRAGGTFTRGTQLRLGKQPIAVALADVTRDGKLDAVVVQSDLRAVTVLAGDGKGGFKPAGRVPVAHDPRAVLIADPNGDRMPDLVVACAAGKKIVVVPGKGRGRFGKSTLVDGGAFPVALAAADFDGDGKLDLAAVSASTKQVAVLGGNGKGGFGEASFFPAGARPVAVAAADLDGDGKPDLAVVNETDKSVTILLNKR